MTAVAYVESRHFVSDLIQAATDCDAEAVRVTDSAYDFGDGYAVPVAEMEHLALVVAACEVHHVDQVALECAARATRVTAKRGPFASPHEAMGVLIEELIEFCAVVLVQDGLRSKDRLIAEARDIATAALRYAAQLEAEP